MRVLEEAASVNAVVREYLEEYAGRERELVEAACRFIATSRESASGWKPDRHRWKWEDSYGACMS